MSSKGQKSKKVSQDLDDDMEFLLAASAANKVKVAESIEKSIIPDSVFASLPAAPIDVNPSRNFGPRDIMEYDEKIGYRPKEEQMKNIQKLEEALPDFREAGIIHQSVREWAMNSEIIKPGVKLYDMCGQIEEAVRRMVKFDPPYRGLAFPCGCSINHCAAHYSPVPGDETVLGSSDVMKIDYGVAINGHIIDSAFTVSFNPVFDPLIKASREATNAAIKMSGPDARLGDIGATIEEIICSYQLELEGKIYNIKPVYNLGGHQMDDYIIHCGNHIPLCKDRSGSENNERMKYGELYALETFATSGKGIVFDDGATSHFMVSRSPAKIKNGSQKELYDCIQNNFKTMAFCQRFIERTGMRKYQLALNDLVHLKAVTPYPPLSDIKGSYVSQHEHTFAILEHHKEVFSRE